MAVPCGAVDGAVIGAHFALVDTLAQSYSLRGSGVETWFGFALLEVLLAVVLGCVAGALIGFLVSGALAAAWVAQLGGAATSVCGAATAALASITLLLLAFGPSAQLEVLAACAALHGAAGVVLLVWFAGLPQAEGTG